MEAVKRLKTSQLSKQAVHRIAVAKKKTQRFVSTVLYYLVVAGLSFVFLYPMLYIFSQSMMQASDVTDATVQWVPKQFSFTNYATAFENLSYWKSFTNNVIISVGSAIAQVFSCAVAGYGFARYRFPGYGIFLSLVVFTFLVPPQTIIVPLFLLISDFHWINTYFPFIVPGLFGHGLWGALFVLIFIQFFHRLPHELEEAARIDGAGAFRTFVTIMLPLARPAMLVVFLFSVVWHWNDVFEPGLYLNNPQYFNLTQHLSILQFQAHATGSPNMETIGEAGNALGGAPTSVNKIMAGSMLTILPLLILYLFTQRYFVEGVERTGIAGE